MTPSNPDQGLFWILFGIAGVYVLYRLFRGK